MVDLDDYGNEIATRMSAAWESDTKNTSRSPNGGRSNSMTESPKIPKYHFPSEHLGKAYKFSRPFRRPYRVDKMFPNGAEVTSLNGGRAQTIRVALDCARHCPRELEDNAEDLSLDRLEELEGDNSMEDSISEAECTNGQDPMSCPTPGGDVDDKVAEERPNTSRVRRSRRIKKKKRPMS